QGPPRPSRTADANDPLRPIAPLSVAVASLRRSCRSMEADVCVRARGDEWRRLAAHVVDAEAGAVMAEKREDVVVPPTLVPELEDVHVFARQECEERF